MKKAFAFAPLALTGCGPTPEQIAGTGLVGAVLFALVTWLTLLAVQRVTDRIRTGAWQPVGGTRGFVPMLVPFAFVSVGAFLYAPQATSETAVIWSFAAANFLAWSLIVRLITGWSAAGAILLGGFLSLGPAVGGALGSRPLAVVTFHQWAWGGFFGAVPGGIILLVWFVAWLKRTR